MMARTLGLGAIVAIGCCMSAFSQAEVLRDAAHSDWAGERLIRQLEDGSVMTEYLANTVASDRADALLTVAFMPRFECTPLIGIRIDSEVTDDLERTTSLLRSLQMLDNGDRLSIVVDRKRVPFPVLVDHSSDGAALWYGVDREDRETLLLQMDGGDRAEIALSTNTTLKFSLRGSRRSMLAVKKNCLLHEPVPFEAKQAN